MAAWGLGHRGPGGDIGQTGLGVFWGAPRGRGIQPGGLAIHALGELRIYLDLGPETDLGPLSLKG